MPSQIKAKQIRSKAITEKLNYELKAEDIVMETPWNINFWNT